MLQVETVKQVREYVAKARAAGKRIGLVPTMGALHQGHLSLVKASKAQCACTVVSIFVNPTQFGPDEDLQAYPCTLDADRQACHDLGVDLLFVPTVQQMYPQPQLTWVNVDKLPDHLCGQSRPQHFRGVCTVVAKLFNIVQPDLAYFGQKDAQQLAILRRMAADLNLPVQIQACPIVREPNGLAMSSRNRYLSSQQRQQARCLNDALTHAQQLINAGQRDADTLIQAIRQIIDACPDAQVDYISLVDPELLQPMSVLDRDALIALAVKIGPARLIDNRLVRPPGTTDTAKQT